LLCEIAALAALADLDAEPIAPVIETIQVDLGLNAIAIHMTKFKYCLHDEMTRLHRYRFDIFSIM